MNGNIIEEINLDTQKIEFGDFQTPEYFSDAVCGYLKKYIQINPDIIIEPTCGIGNFLVSSQKEFAASKYYGIEVKEDYIEEAKKRVKLKTTFFNENLFTFGFEKIVSSLATDDTVLIVGNPPWVNNSVLSELDSANVPVKSNFKKLKGFDAMTGSSNFDICEYMILQLIDAFENTNTTIAMLCKTIVARNTFQELHRNEVNFNVCKMINIDAKKIFNVGADACLFIIGLTPNDSSRLDSCEVYDFETPNELKSMFGYREGKFYASLTEECMDLDGNCCFEWRQGIKHDCSKVMELEKKADGFYNGNKEKLEIEDTLIYPLVKSSHVKKVILNEYKKYVIVTQKKVRENTGYIKDIAPKTWEYLNNNIEAFRKRKSSIYKNAPEFSMFGIGDYSYAEYKVGISGFYKTPIFALMIADKSVMMDDTCYFLNFDTYDMAYTAMLILNSSLVQEFLKSIAFKDSKRPYTKKVLERIDFGKVFEHIDLEELKYTETQLGLNSYIRKEIVEEFKRNIN